MSKAFRNRFWDSLSDHRRSKACPEPCRRIQSPKLAGFLAILVTLTMWEALASAQQSTKVPRIGFLSGGSLRSERTEAFRQALRDLGYVEGKNLVIEWRGAEGKRERRDAFAAELVRLKVDAIV